MEGDRIREIGTKAATFLNLPQMRMALVMNRVGVNGQEHADKVVLEFKNMSGSQFGVIMIMLKKYLEKMGDITILGIEAPTKEHQHIIQLIPVCQKKEASTKE